MGLIPLNAFIECDAGAAKDIQGTPDGQIHFAIAANMDFLQILNAPSTTCIGDRNGAPFGQL